MSEITSCQEIIYVNVGHCLERFGVSVMKSITGNFFSD